MPKLSLTQYQRHAYKWESCTECFLHEGRRNVVLYRGATPCDILFIGEAPGVTEDRFGEPFVGPAGHLLDEIILRSLENLMVCDSCNTIVFREDETDQCYCGNRHDRELKIGFTNVIACIPKEDGIKVSDPPTECIKACKPRLEEIINITKPRAVVTVGAVAEKNVKTLFTSPRIMIVHPAAILRSSEAQKGFTIQKVIAQLSTFVTEL